MTKLKCADIIDYTAWTRIPPLISAQSCVTRSITRRTIRSDCMHQRRSAIIAKGLKATIDA